MTLNAFANAIDADNFEDVRMLIENGFVNVNARLPRVNNPPALVYAAGRSKFDIVQFLLQENARIDETDANGHTACFLACVYHSLAVLTLLLSYRPNLHIKNRNGLSLLQYLSQFTINAPIWLAVLNAGASIEGVGSNALCIFASKSTAAIQALLDRGIVVNSLTRHSGNTPLHEAIQNGHDIPVLDMLVNVCKVDVEKRNQRGNTCLHTACWVLHNSATRWLISIGANVDSRNQENFSLLHIACDYECFIMILAAGCNLHTLNAYGESPMRYAAALGRMSEVYALLGAGDVIDATAQKFLSDFNQAIDPYKVEQARKDIAKERLDFVRYRALQVCIGLQPLSLPALQMCEILLFACGPIAPLIPFYQWWKIATAVKHYYK
jgi:ankyrin repeat protein